MDLNKKIKLLDFKLTKSLWSSFFWVYKSSFVWNWIDFSEHKEYNFWDPIKNIDWKTMARTNRLYTKVFEEERDLKILFVIDINKNMNFWFYDKIKKDILEEIFFMIWSSANFYWDSIWAVLYDWIKNIYIPYKKWIFNIFNVIWELDNAKNFTNIDLDRTNNVFNYLNKMNIKNNLIFFLSDDINLSLNNTSKILSSKNQIYYINIFDNFEDNLENLDMDISLWFDWDFLNISLKNKDKIEQYKNNRLSNINKFEKLLLKNNISYKNVNTNNDVFKEIFLYFNSLKK